MCVWFIVHRLWWVHFHRPDDAKLHLNRHNNWLNAAYLLKSSDFLSSNPMFGVAKYNYFKYITLVSDNRGWRKAQIETTIIGYHWMVFKAIYFRKKIPKNRPIFAVDWLTNALMLASDYRARFFFPSFEPFLQWYQIHSYLSYRSIDACLLPLNFSIVENSNSNFCHVW